METTNISNPDRIKTPRIRSVAYPSYTAVNCYDLVNRIDKVFTDVVYTPREDISKQLSLSGGALMMQLSSCVQYDLLDLKSKEGYKPTELYKKIKRPLPDENVNDFYIECLQAPELYKKLILDFKDKQLPQVSGLANILDRRYSVKGNASNIAAKIFLKNLEAHGLIDDDNILRFDAAITPFEEVTPDSNMVNGPAIQYNSKPLLLNQNGDIKKIGTIVPNTEFTEIPIFSNETDGTKREWKVLLPLDFTDADVMRTIKVLNGYLP